MKSVTFNPQVEVMFIPSEDTTNKLVVQRRQNRSYAHINLEMQQRQSDAIKATSENIKSIRQNLRVIQEKMNMLIPGDKGYVYYRELRNDTLFELKLLISKMKHYKKNVC
jgi:hypothetical protein